MNSFTIVYVAMIVITGSVLAGATVLVIRDQQRVRRQCLHASKILADLYRRELMKSPPGQEDASPSDRPGRSARRSYPTVALSLVGGTTPTALPVNIHILVLLGLFLGVWAIAGRRTVLGVCVVILALAVAGATVLIQEAETVLHAARSDSAAASKSSST